MNLKVAEDGQLEIPENLNILDTDTEAERQKNEADRQRERADDKADEVAELTEKIAKATQAVANQLKK